MAAPIPGKELSFLRLPINGSGKRNGESLDNKLALLSMLRSRVICIWFLQTFDPKLVQQFRPLSFYMIRPQTDPSFDNMQSLWTYYALSMNVWVYIILFLPFIIKTNILKPA